MPVTAGKQVAFNAKDYERPGLLEDEILQIKEAFDIFDTEGCGTVDPKELKAAMKALEFDAKNQTIYQMISDLDADGAGGIDFTEFLDLMTARISDEDTEADLERVVQIIRHQTFKLFDHDKTGFVAIQNLRMVANELGEDIDDQDLQEMIECADSDNDGLVTFEDFYRLITKKALGGTVKG